MNLECPIQEVGDLKGQVDERGPWIYVGTAGRRYFPCSPRPEEVEIEHIAHALSQINRYTGHTRFPVSVAQHAVLCSLLAPSEVALEALLHDAAEAYVGDLSRPVKQWLRARDPSWDILEDLNARVIARRFDLRYPWPAAVAVADNAALAIEVRNAHCGEFSQLLTERGIVANPNMIIGKVSPLAIKREFLHMYERLRRDK